MNKSEFIAALRKRLVGLPKQDIDERLVFYSEMIDDRIEEGYTEEEAVSDIGSVDEIAEQIIGDIPLSEIAKERLKPKRRLEGREIVLLVLGSPIWLSLAIAAIAVIISLYAVLLSCVISLVAVFVALVACGLFLTVIGGANVIIESIPIGLALIGGGAVCTGLGIFMFFGCSAATKGTIALTKRMALGIKKCFVKGEEI